MKAMRVLAILVMLAFAGAAAVRGGEPGVTGIASHYGPGHGVAMHFCTWTVRHSVGCGWVQIQSADTGLVVEAPVVDYCGCHVEPSSHPDRIVDLQWGVLDALGLERSQGLYQVTVWRIPDGPLFEMPNSAMAAPSSDWLRPLLALIAIWIALIVAILAALNAHRTRIERAAQRHQLPTELLEEVVAWLE